MELYGLSLKLLPRRTPTAKEDPDTPSNFRPIALTACVGKLFTTVLKNRWLSFMVSNGYLDTSVQKAFVPGVPGCLEQYTKLSAAISEAYKNYRSLTVCWLDLANAYGSVHHSLIDYARSTTMPLPVSTEFFPTFTTTSRLPSPVPPGQPSPSLSGLVCTRATLCRSWCSTP